MIEREIGEMGSSGGCAGAVLAGNSVCKDVCESDGFFFF